MAGHPAGLAADELQRVRFFFCGIIEGRSSALKRGEAAFPVR
jgi:hypothetical protein